LIVYLDSSVVVRTYLRDERGHAEAASLLSDPDVAPVTSTLTRVEVAGALVRASAAGRGDADRLLELLDADLGESGPVVVLRPDQIEVETLALALVREHPLRALDAWHLAVAHVAVPALARPQETIAFATRDETQASAAEDLGFEVL
jgi:predicted nucleic acid-binding protein